MGILKKEMPPSLIGVINVTGEHSFYQKITLSPPGLEVGTSVLQGRVLTNSYVP